MKRWVLNIVQGQSRDAVTKPKSDVVIVAGSMSYERLSVRMQDTSAMLDETLRAMIDGIIAEVVAGDIVLYQFPTLLGFRFDETFVEMCKQKGAKVTVLMHDSEWLRGFYPQENTFLNGVDAVIGHGDAMNNALREYGVTTKIIKKDLFDYVLDDEYPLENNLEKKAVVAGNLDKSIFVEEWSMDMPELHAYGNKTKQQFGKNVTYHGSFQSKELLRVLPKNVFGISWDDNLPGGGDYQRYTRFNSPYKVALYLSLGLPVIVWEESGIAGFIERNQLGFTISTPKEIGKKMSALTEDDLRIYKQNANNVALAIRSGLFTRRAIMAAEDEIFGMQEDGNFYWKR